MVKLLGIAVMVALLVGSNQQLVKPLVCSWSKWYDWDNPKGFGDVEYLPFLQLIYPGQICDDKVPVAIEAVTVASGTPAQSTGQPFVVFSPSQGLICRNKPDQKKGPRKRCFDYKVRFGCACREIIDIGDIIEPSRN
ncbi:cartilage intermediate layer protein 1-like [Aulostomus maculatus]